MTDPGGIFGKMVTYEKMFDFRYARYFGSLLQTLYIQYAKHVKEYRDQNLYINYCPPGRELKPEDNMMTNLRTNDHVLRSRYTDVDCKPAITALSDEKFFRHLSSCR